MTRHFVIQQRGYIRMSTIDLFSMKEWKNHSMPMC